MSFNNCIHFPSALSTARQSIMTLRATDRQGFTRLHGLTYLLANSSPGLGSAIRFVIHETSSRSRQARLDVLSVRRLHFNWRLATGLQMLAKRDVRRWQVAFGVRNRRPTPSSTSQALRKTMGRALSSRLYSLMSYFVGNKGWGCGECNEAERVIEKVYVPCSCLKSFVRSFFISRRSRLLKNVMQLQ